ITIWWSVEVCTSLFKLISLKPSQTVFKVVCSVIQSNEDAHRQNCFNDIVFNSDAFLLQLHLERQRLLRIVFKHKIIREITAGLMLYGVVEGVSHGNQRDGHGRQQRNQGK